MRASWACAGAAALVLCLSPGAQAREKARERHDDRGRPTRERHSDRGDRRADREEGRSNHQGDRSRSGGAGWTRERRDGRQSRSVDRRDDGQSRGSARRDERWSRGSGGRDDGRWSRGSGGRDDGRWSRGSARRDDGRWRGPDRRDDRRWREAPRRDSRGGWLSFRYRPRYPAHYRYGYYHRHGYYFPRYYFDYESYPTHASIRVLADPPEAEVYVDGYYAGVVDDFDGVFQRLRVAPGRHEITLRLDGYVTWTAEVFANPYSTLNLRHEMMPGANEPYYGGDDPSADGGPDEYQDPSEYDRPR